MSKQTVKTRLLIISDTHCAPLRESQADDTLPTAFRNPLPSADVLIHCGDLTRRGNIQEFHEALDMLREIDAPVKLVIAGNHDRLLDRDYVLSHAVHNQQTTAEAAKLVREARDLWTSLESRAVRENITFLDEGCHRVRLANGASFTIYASPYTPEFCDWAFPYEHDEDRFNPPTTVLSDAKSIAPFPIPSYVPNTDSIDLLITHGPPFGRLDTTYRGDQVGCAHGLRALMRARPLVHCFGHIHEGWGAERIRWADSNVIDELIRNPCTTEEWIKGKWREGVDEIRAMDVDLEEVKREHAAFVDVSKDGEEELEQGRETLLVNASIMNVRYRPVNAPWVVDVDLPMKQGEGLNYRS